MKYKKHGLQLHKNTEQMILSTARDKRAYTMWFYEQIMRVGKINLWE